MQSILDSWISPKMAIRLSWIKYYKTIFTEETIKSPVLKRLLGIFHNTVHVHLPMQTIILLNKIITFPTAWRTIFCSHATLSFWQMTLTVWEYAYNCNCPKEHSFSPHDMQKKDEEDSSFLKWLSSKTR